MEDVVLHYQPGSAAGLSSLLQRTEKLVEPFPCRTPPVFTPWFPAAADRHLPIRPAKPAPVITYSESRTHTQAAQPGPQKPETDALLVERPAECLHAETTTSPPKNSQEAKDDVPETPNCLPSASCNRAEREITRLSPDERKVGPPFTDSPTRRSWSVFTWRGVLLQSLPPLSKQFHHVVSVHGLHLHQRVKWVISQHNCGASQDIEQVWQTISRSIQSARLPTCHANIERERAEIWVFCDVVQSELVGHFLKDELRLSGRIRLSGRRLGNIFSM